MAVISGNDGAFSYGSAVDFPITEWTVEKKGEVADVTDSASTTYKDFVAVGFLDWTAKFKGFLKAGATLPTFHTLTTVVFTAKSGTTFSGSGIITGESIALKVDGTDGVTIDFTLQGVGALSEANSA